MIRQELNPETCKLDRKQVKIRLAGTSERRPFLISQVKASVFVSARLAMIPGTPCISIKIRKGEDRRKKKREVLHPLRCYTHTHARAHGKKTKIKEVNESRCCWDVSLISGWFAHGLIWMPGTHSPQTQLPTHCANTPKPNVPRPNPQ